MTNNQFNGQNHNNQNGYQNYNNQYPQQNNNQGQSYQQQGHPYNPQQGYYQQPQQPYNQNGYQPHQQNQMYQGNQMGEQLKRGRKKGPNLNFKFIGIGAGIIGLIIALFFGYQYFFGGPSFEELPTEEQALVAFEHKINTVMEGENPAKMKFLDDFSYLYFFISSNDPVEPGINSEMVQMNADIAIMSETIKNLEGKEKEEYVKEFNEMIKINKGYINGHRELTQRAIRDVMPLVTPTTDVEKESLNQMKLGYMQYIQFLTLYEQYLNNPNQETLNKAF